MVKPIGETLTVSPLSSNTALLGDGTSWSNAVFRMIPAGPFDARRGSVCFRQVFWHAQAVELEGR